MSLSAVLRTSHVARSLVSRIRPYRVCVAGDEARQFYGLSFRFQLLSTPCRQDAVTFNSWREAPPQRDFHPPIHAPSQAHERGGLPPLWSDRSCPIRRRDQVFHTLRRMNGRLAQIKLLKNLQVILKGGLCMKQNCAGRSLILAGSIGFIALVAPSLLAQALQPAVPSGSPMGASIQTHGITFTAPVQSFVPPVQPIVPVVGASGVSHAAFAPPGGAFTPSSGMFVPLHFVPSGATFVPGTTTASQVGTAAAGSSSHIVGWAGTTPPPSGTFAPPTGRGTFVPPHVFEFVPSPHPVNAPVNNAPSSAPSRSP